MDLSIIIVNYNTLELTRNCIESVIRFTEGISYEIILVDNASTDGSIEYFSKMEGIKFIESGGNIGFGRANNIGFKNSSGRILLMLNSDTIVENDIIGRMVCIFDRQPSDVACMGSLLVHGDRQPSYSFGFYKQWTEEFSLSKETMETKTILGEQMDVGYVSGADLFVRRNVAEQLGLFDPDFFMYYEDMELGYRYKKNGFRSVIVNERGILHLEGASSNHSYKKICIMTQAYFTYLRKVLSKSEFLCAKFCVAFRRSITVWHYRWSLKESLNYIKLLINA